MKSTSASRYFVFYFYLIIGFLAAHSATIDTHNISPVYAKMINGTCLVIGNTNTKLASGLTDYNAITDISYEKADLENTLADGFKGEVEVDGGGTVDIYNSSFANFCIPKVRCGELNIEISQLNWGGRVNPKDVDLIADRQTVYIKFVSETYASPVFKITAETTIEPGKFYYSCHADITDLLNSIKDSLSTGQVNLYVGNVAASLEVVNEAADNLDPSLSSTCSGWSLDLVYANASFPRRNIAIYNYDKLQCSNSLGDEYPYLNPQFQFAWSGSSENEAFKYSMSDTITFIYSGFGGMKNIDNDVIYFATAGKSEMKTSDFKVSYVNSLEKKIDENHFNSGIDYNYDVDDCKVGKLWEYAPGYDLHAVTMDPGNFRYIAKNADGFSLLVKPDLEHHFLSNVVLVTGAPETPQIQLYTRTPGSIEPGQTYKSDVTLSVGDNKEGMTNMKITIPISEYVDSVTALTTSCLENDVKKNQGLRSVTISSEDQAGPAAFKIDIYFNDFCNGISDKNKEKILYSINKYLAYVNEFNDKMRFVDPAKFKQARIIFNFNNITIPKNISKKDVFTISFDLKTQPEGDPVYLETTYVGKLPSITPEAEISLKTEQTGETSIFENTLEDNDYWDNYRCNIGNGGTDVICKDCCSSLDGTTKSSKGVFVKEEPTLKSIVVVDATSVCRPVPDSISYTICSETEVSIEDLDYQLVSKYDFKIDSIARVDSCIWENRKRDSIVAFAAKHGVNKSRLEKLLSNISGSLLDFSAKAAEAYGCDIGEPAPQTFIDSVELIASAKIRTSRLFALYSSEDTANIYQKTESLRIVPANYAETYTVDKDTTLYIYYQSPWVNSAGDSCSRFIPVYFHKREIPAPAITYDGEDMAAGDTIYLCLEGNLMDFSITKDRNEYDLYTDISTVDDASGDLTDYRDVLVYNGFSKTYNWNAIKSGNFTSENPGIYRFAVRQQMMDCKSDSVVFFVSVADMKIDQGPVIDDSVTTYCQALDSTEKITLRVKKTEEQKDYTVRWYNTRTTTAKADYLGSGDSILVRKDSAEVYRYGATFYSNKCESDTSLILITVLPMPDTISADTIAICQRYHLTADDVFSVLKMKHVAQKLTADNVKFYPYIEADDQEVAGNVTTSINQDSVPLDKLLDGFDFESACQEGGVRYLHFVAQAISPEGCPGAGSLVTIRINCYDDDQPTFGLSGDSILYCMGSKGSADLNNFLSPDEKAAYAKGYKWYWADAEANNHYTYTFGNTTYTTGKNSAPVIDPSFVHTNLLSVVRVDSNNCISRHDTFKVVVDTNINTYPIIADSVIPVADKRFTLTYCKGDYLQNSISIPAEGFPSTDYRIEWYEKDDLNTICNGIDSSGAVMQPLLTTSLEKADTTYYCVRQSTQMGCTGPWLTVQVVVYPDVDDAPQITPATYCQGAIPVPATVNAVNPDVDRYSLTYYRLDTTHVGSAIENDTVAIPYIAPSTQEAGTFTYLAALKDLKTKCRSRFFEMPVTIYPKPGSVTYAGDSVRLFCAGIGNVDLKEEIEAKVNAADYDTRLVWLPSDTLSTTNDASLALHIFQKDTVTGCMGDTTTLALKVEKTFRYSAWPDRVLCWGDTLNLCDSINSRIRPVNHYIDSTAIGFEVRRMVGTTAAKETLGCDVLEAVHSKVGRHESDTATYQIVVLDTVSGCVAYDTVTFIFRGLPNAEPEQLSQDFCEAYPTRLPTPTNKAYTYKWLREDLKTESAETVTLDASEVFSLVEYDEYLCSDTFRVKVTVRSNPKAAPVADLKLCQDGSEVTLAEKVSADEDHLANNLQIQYFNHQGDSIGTKLNTDTIAIDGLKRTLTFTARQTDLIYGCYTDTTFRVELSKGLVLQAPDMAAVCQPDTVSLAKHVKAYLGQNLEKVHLPNLAGVTITYNRLFDATSLTSDEADALTYIEDRDSVAYAYSVTDAASVCSASDTVFVVIDQKPATPIVENGLDSLFLCANNAPFTIGAENTNSKTISSAIFWNTISDLVPTDSVLVDDAITRKSYSAYSKNMATGCISASDTVTVVIAQAVKVSPIAKNDTLALCAGEVMNVAEAATASFTFDAQYQSAVSVLATANGVSTPMQGLTAVTSTGQDTIDYRFTATDALTGCEATNRLVLIFHQKPSVGIDAPKVVCQDSSATLLAVEETRPVTYAWYMDGAATVAGTSAALAVPNAETPHTFKLVETLKGTLCTDSTTFSLDVVTTPTPLSDSTFTFCQQNAEELIQFARTDADAAYGLEWSSNKEDLLSTDTKLAVDLTNDTTLVRYIRQVNSAKGLTCPSKWAKAEVKVNKHIEVTLPDTFICSPLTFNLAGFANQRKSESEGGYQLALSNVYLLEGLGTPLKVDDSTRVAKAGNYQVSYTDKNGCESRATTTLQFISKPLTPEVSADSILLCQGADTFITVKPVAGSFVYHWQPVGSTTNLTADTLKIVADLPTASAIQVWREDANHCMSDTVTFKYTVVDSIGTNLVAIQHICEGETVNLDSLGHLAFNFNADLAYAYYPLTTNGEKGAQMLQTEAVGTEGSYLVVANNAASGCKAQQVLGIDVHSNPVLLYRGDTVRCENDTFNLTAFTTAGSETPAWKWTIDERTVNDSVLHFIAKVATPHEALEQKAELQGTYVVTNSKRCVTSRTVTLLTNAAPDALLSDTADLCQNTGSVTLPVDYQQSSFNLEITTEGKVVDAISVGTDSVANYLFNIRQIDRATKCKGQSVPVYVNVHPALSLQLPAITAICQPAVVDFARVVDKAAAQSNASIAENKQIATVAYYLNGTALDDASAIGTSGIYRAVIEDQYGCQASDDVTINVGLQPEKVKADTGFCQATGNQLLTGNGTTANYALQWLDLSTAYPDSLYADSVLVSTLVAGEQNYLMRQVDRKTGCPSEATPTTVTIYPAIGVGLRDTLLCNGETFNFADYAANQATGGTHPTLASYSRTIAISPLNYEAVAQSGTFVATYTDDHACHAADTMLVDFAPEIVISVTSNAPVCEGDTLQLKAEGADFYAWNNGNAGSERFTEVATANGTLQVPLKAGIRVNNLVCETDTVLSYTVKVVPDLLPVADTAIAYCQGTTTQPLTVTPSLAGAKVLWYSPADGYTTVAQNSTLVPSAQTAGTYVYKFRQQLDGCQTPQQEVTVEIQQAITDLPVTADTAYCLNETSVPLMATTGNSLYDVVWTNADGDTLPLGYKPATTEAGLQLYQARLHYRACYGKPVPERVTVAPPYSEKPDVDNAFLFCQNTGNYTLQANSVASGARLNWYTTPGGVRYDSIVVPSAEGAVNWTTNNYYVTQSVIDGCESEPLTVTVNIEPSSESKVMALDTCANLQVKMSTLFQRNGITDVLDTLWRVDGGQKERIDANANIGYTGTYLAATHNEWGCKALQTANINMLQVEDFTHSTIKTLYCYDDTVSLSASASNASLEWYNPATDETVYANNYTFRLQGAQNVSLIATVLNMPVCADTVNYTFETYPYIEPKVDGNMQVCLGSEVQLSTSNVYNAAWTVSDTVATGDNFHFYPDQSCIVSLTGVDKNNCPVGKKLEISTAKVPQPSIEVVPNIHSTTYQLNRDTFDLTLKAVLDDNYDEGLTYFWNYGDGNKGYGNMTEYYAYDSALVRLTAPITVKLQVAHEYGCTGEATTTLLVDPDFDVPNTMAGGETFMANYELQIFDRIGNLIYKGVGWQGQKNNGEAAFADTYFYAITYFVNGDKKVKTGYITLVR